MAKLQTETRLIADLNDLLQLDHDAMQAYGLAIEAIENGSYRETLIRFRRDHERHIQRLAESIEDHGGTPIQLPHIPTGPMKLAVQAAGRVGGDRELLMAFKSNERQVRDKYQRMSDERWPPDVAAVLHRNAADEEKHYAWVSQVLADLGVGGDTRSGRAQEAFETAHSRAADAMESAERRMMAGLERARRSPMPAVLLGIGSVLAVRRILRSR